jgi:ribosomal-protein-alanine N-acetyltransferase
MLVERLTGQEPWAVLAAIDAIADASFPEGLSVRDELARTWGRIWIARTAADALPVGFLVAWHVADELHVLNIATTPAMRRRGVARALMDEALAYAAREHIRLLLLEVRRSNVAAIKLYRGLGFSASGVRPNYYSNNGEDAVEMMLTLDTTTGAPLAGSDEVRVDD